MALTLVAVMGCSQEPNQSSARPSTSSTVLSITSAEQMAATLASAGPRLVAIKFYASWCGPCRELLPIYERLARKYEGRFIACEVDVDDLKDLANQYRVAGIPMVVLIKNGTTVEEIKGLRSASTYESAILKHLSTS